MRRGEAGPARGLARQLAAEHPGHALSWLAMARVSHQAGQGRDAADALDRALDLAPSDPSVNAHGAMIFTQLGISRRARACAETVIAASPDDAALLGLAGSALNLNGDFAGAIGGFRAAVAKAPKDAVAHYNLATVEKYLGHLIAARDGFEHAVALKPDFGNAHYQIATFDKKTESNNSVDRLRQLLARRIGFWRDEVSIRYALGKELNDLGDFRAAFEAFASGAALQKRHFRFDLQAELTRLENITAGATASALPVAKAAPSESPIFILGLPRTGSTLVERILDSHPDVTSKGELNIFPMLLGRQLAALGQGKAGFNLETAIAGLDFGALGRDYLHEAHGHLPDGPRFIDKLPANSEHVGLILRAIPDAKIVYLDRDPRDTAIAVFTTRFNTAYPWSCDLADIATYLRAHRKLMDHWRQEFPGQVFTVRYEDLVSDQEAQTRALLAHCDLEWNEACLRFFENRSAVSTASAMQVREPIHSSSVGRWKSYSPFLGNALDGFAEAH